MRLRAQRRRPRGDEGRQSAVRRRPGQRKSSRQRGRDRHRHFGPWFGAAQGQCGRPSGRGHRENRNIRSAGATQLHHARVFRAARRRSKTKTPANGCARSKRRTAATTPRALSDESPIWNSMLRDTIAPTMLQAGIRVNVVPSEARGDLNIRLLPGDSIEPLMAKLQELVNDPQIRFEVAAGRPGGGAAFLADIGSLQRDRARRGQDNFPARPSCPFVHGRHRFRQLRLHNVQAYGLLPFPLDGADILACTATTSAFRSILSARASSSSTGWSATSPWRNNSHERNRRAKIVCTLGPASNSPEMIDRLMRAGMDVARLNFSHGTQEEHAARVAAVRRASRALSTDPSRFWPICRGRKSAPALLEKGKRRCNCASGSSSRFRRATSCGTAEGVSTTFHATARRRAQRRPHPAGRRPDRAARADYCAARCDRARSSMAASSASTRASICPA